MRRDPGPPDRPVRRPAGRQRGRGGREAARRARASGRRGHAGAARSTSPVATGSPECTAVPGRASCIGAAAQRAAGDLRAPRSTRPASLVAALRSAVDAHERSLGTRVARPGMERIDVDMTAGGQGRHGADHRRSTSAARRSPPAWSTTTGEVLARDRRPTPSTRPGGSSRRSPRLVAELRDGAPTSRRSASARPASSTRRAPPSCSRRTSPGATSRCATRSSPRSSCRSSSRTTPTPPPGPSTASARAAASRDLVVRHRRHRHRRRHRARRAALPRPVRGRRRVRPHAGGARTGGGAAAASAAAGSSTAAARALLREAREIADGAARCRHAAARARRRASRRASTARRSRRPRSEGDPAALRVLRARSAAGWARALADLAAVLDPGAFVVGGGRRRRRRAAARARPGARSPAALTGRGYRPVPELRLAELGNDAGLVGAADLARRA